MRKGNLVELFNELKDQNAKKFDVVVPNTHVKMQNGMIVIDNDSAANGNKSNDDIAKVLELSGISKTNTSIGTTEDSILKGNTTLSLDVLDTAHDHICTKLDIPKRYYQRMSIPENFPLLDANVNHWLEQEKNKSFFLRTFIDKEEKTGICRAFLSDKFKVIDNYDVLLSVLEAIKESNIKLDIDYCDVTDKKMYVRFTNPNIVIESKELLKNYRLPNGSGIANTNFGIVSGFIISNSEVGHGQFSISPRAVVLACQNGMTFNSDKFAKTHLGAKMDEFSVVTWSEETRQKNRELIMSQVKDAIKHYNTEEYFAGKIQELESKGLKKLENPINCCKNVTKSLSITDEKERNILNYFVQSADFTAFGVTQALTYFAHESNDADEQWELEHNAVTVLDTIEKFDVPEKKSTVKRQMAEN